MRKSSIKFLGSILLGLGIFLAYSPLQGQPLQEGVKGARTVRKAARVPLELAVVPAVEKTLQHSLLFPAPSVSAFTAPTTRLAKVLTGQIPFYTPDETVSNWLKHSINVIPAPWRRGIFQARPLNKLGMNVFSGTVVKVNYEGAEEIYGVIATHTLAAHEGDPSLSQTFTADVYVRGEWLSVPVEIVQISASGGLDLALVKFPASIERELRPFELSDAPLTAEDELQTVGFCKLSACYLPDRYLLSQNALYLRASIELPPEQRRGLCGAPVLDEEGKLVGFHTGGSYGERGESIYIGFATRAEWIRSLVKAYHTGGKAKVPFVLNGQKIVDLEINEFVSYIELMDGDGEVLWERPVHSKFPYREVEQIIREFRPRYIDLVTSMVSWEGNHLVSRTKHKFGSVCYRYDLLNRQAHVVNEE